MPRGGKRVGAGAKPHAYSEETKKKMMAAIAKAAKEEKRDPEDILADIVVRMTFKHGAVGIREWLAAYSLYLDTIVVKSSHKQIDVEVRESGFVELPEIKRPKEEEMAKA